MSNLRYEKTEIERMAKVLSDFCEGRSTCTECALEDKCRCGGGASFKNMTLSDAEIVGAYHMAFGNEPKEKEIIIKINHVQGISKITVDFEKGNEND